MRQGYVYRLYDACGSLLYVGSTVNVEARRVAHERGKPWARDIARWTVEGPMDLPDARQLERDVIRDEQPKHNVHHTGRSFPRRSRSRDSDRVVVSVGIPREHVEELRRIAKRDHRTMAGQLRHMVADLLAAEKDAA